MKWVIWTAGLLLAILLAPVSGGAERGVTVYAAASLTEVLEDVAVAFTADSRIPVRFSFGASSMLARQIEAGAPADVFISADQEWMDYLQTRGLIDPGTRHDIVANDLVLVAPVSSTLSLKIGPGFTLAAALGEAGRLALADPYSVPAGLYARTALVRLGVWSGVERRIVSADNVRTALNFVARGEAPLGIVYATDARVEPRVRVVDVFPAATHAPITYPAAAAAGSSAGRCSVRSLPVRRKGAGGLQQGRLLNALTGMSPLGRLRAGNTRLVLFGAQWTIARRRQGYAV